MGYSAIAHGATGIMWFALDPRSSGNPHSIPEAWTARAQMSSFKRNGRFVRTGNLVSSAPLWNACRGLANELQELAPALAEGVALRGLSASPGARTHHDVA